MKILDQSITDKGGSIEVCLSKYGYDGETMTAYQEYIGGGELGPIHIESTIPDWDQYKALVNISKRVANKYGELADINVEYYETNL